MRTYLLHWNLIIVVLLVSFVVQMLYAYRIYVALKQSWIACFVTVVKLSNSFLALRLELMKTQLAVAQLGIGIYAAASLYQPHPLTKGFSVAADIIVRDLLHLPT